MLRVGLMNKSKRSRHNKFIQPLGNNALLFSVPRFVAQRLTTALGVNNKTTNGMKIILKFLLVLLITWPVYSQSQEPVLGRLNTIQTPQDQSQKYQADTKTNKKKSTNSSTLQEQPFSQSNNIQHPKDSKNQNDYTSPEWWLVYVTIALVAVTTGLAVYTALLWRATKRLAVDAKKTADRQAMETQQSLAIAKASADHTKESVDLARKEFISTHRPKIILRDAYCLDNEIDSPIIVHYVLVNSGETPARIILSVLELKLIYGPGFGAETPPSIQNNQNDIGDLPLDPGEEVTRTYSGTRHWRTDDGSRFKSNYSYEGVFFYGHIIYEDLNGIKRHTAFWRKYDLDTSRFYLCKDPAFESLDYAD